MAKTYQIHIMWSGHGDDIYNQPVSLLASGEDNAREMFSNIVSEGLAIKNDGLFLAAVSPEMTEEEINTYSDDKEALCAIIKDEDEKFSLGSLIKEYATSNDDWAEGSLTVIYDNDETDADVTMTNRG